MKEASFGGTKWRLTEWAQFGVSVISSNLDFLSQMKLPRCKRMYEGVRVST